MRGRAARLAYRGVRAYQLVSAGRPPVCRHVPSCSAYALESLHEHGLVRGLWLTARRLSRCHPWRPMGWDPVPASRGDSVKHRVTAGPPVARAARERSEQEREAPPVARAAREREAPRRSGWRHHLPTQVLRETGDV